jgi:hypothetical protein
MNRQASAAALWGTLLGGALIAPVIAEIISGSLPLVSRQIQANNSLGVALTIGGPAIAVPAILLCGLLGGYYCGFAISVGRWASLLQAQGATLRVRPGHPDGAAGWGRSAITTSSRR